MHLSSNFVILHEIRQVNKALACLIVRKSQFVQQLSKASVSFLSTFPELTLVISQVLRAVFLGLMLKDGLGLEIDVFGSQRDNDSSHGDLPFGPGTTI
jgi:hypothetical protein